jgi:putative nucleotidyltransferase with HDIG domain
LIDIAEIVRKIEFLPPIPASLYKVMQLLDQPAVQADLAVEMIRHDPSLSANILKLCRSPFYARGGTIDSLQQAALRIGFNELKKMTALIASREVMGEYYPGYEERRGALWRHSMAAAIVAEGLQSYSPRTGGDLFTTALLHDIGKIILSDYVGPGYEEIEAVVRKQGLTFHEAERNVLGITHAEAGAMVLAKWSFPADMVDAVRSHHQPDLAPDSPLTHMVALSDLISMLMGFGTEIDALNYKGFGDIYKRYGVGDSAIEKLMAESLEKIKDIEAGFQ